MVVTWSDASGPQRATPSIAIVNERDEVAGYAFDERYALSMTEVLCARIDHGVRCAFALTDRDEFDSNQGLDAARTVLISTELTQQRSAAQFERRVAIQGARGAAVINAARPELSLARDGGLARALSDGGLASIDPSVLELATIGSNDRGLELRATAPTSARCQPGEWNLALRDPRNTASNTASDAGAGTTSVAVMDARPRGARIRSSGANGETPLVLWLDAPQCSERLFVIRAHRRGETLALTSATEFDAASDRASLSIAWREGDRLRWARYRCP